MSLSSHFFDEKSTYDNEPNLQTCKVCTIETCHLVHHARGFCKTHYQKFMLRTNPKYLENNRKIALRSFWKNHDKAIEQMQIYRKNNPEKIKQIHKNYRKNNLPKIRNRQRGFRIILLDLLGGSCSKCNIDDYQILNLDHKFGGGLAERKKFGGVYCMYLFYIRNPEKAKENLQVLCENHNRIKVYENRELNIRTKVMGTVKIRLDILEKLGGKCKECGFKDVRALHLDHIHSDGRKQTKKLGNYGNMIRFYRDNPIQTKKNLQVLCANCNRKKVYLRGEHYVR